MCAMHYKRMKRGAPMDGPPRPNTPGTVQERVARRLPAHFDAECWEWPGARNSLGYGVTTSSGTRAERRSMRVTWIVYEMFHGPMPDGAIIMHVCDNPPCVNPHHLAAGTRTLNMVDKIAKGRQHSKLTADQVRAIRADPRPDKVVATELAVSPATIFCARTRRTWAWLD